MSEDSNLLTRRQLIGLFGGVGAAVALGGAEALEGIGSGEGNINAGRMALSQAYKAGDNLWHGPLSARSEVPQRDGVAFIQTDAGANSDQYKIFHYDSGWVARGFNTPALTTDNLSTDAHTASFVVYDRGGTIYADAQQQGYSSFSGSDFATVLNNAIGDLNDATNADGGVISIRRGTYTVSTTIDFLGKNNVVLRGEGINSTVLQLDSGVDSDVVDTGIDAHFQGLEHIQINGSRPSNTAGNGLIVGSEDFQGHQLLIRKCAEAAMKVNAPRGMRITSSYFEKNDGAGVDINQGILGYIGGSRISKSSPGLQVDGTDCRFVGLEVQACNTHGVAVNDEDNIFTALRSFNNTDSGLQIQGSAKRTVINGAVLTGNGTYGLDIGNSADNSISNVLFDSNTSGAVNPGGVRTRWNGVLGGGPVSEVDLTSTNGGFDKDEAYHDGTGLLPDGIKCIWDGDTNDWKLANPVSFTYTGDGTTGRLLAEPFDFEMVIIEEAGGTVVDGYDGGLSNGVLSGSTFAGEFTVESSGGFTVGDNSADADPNTDGETYQVYAA